jgi:copper(I)-binding protein
MPDSPNKVPQLSGGAGHWQEPNVAARQFFVVPSARRAVMRQMGFCIPLRNRLSPDGTKEASMRRTGLKKTGLKTALFARISCAVGLLLIGPGQLVPKALAAGDGHHDMSGMHAPAGGAVAKAGDLEISGGFVKAMLPGQPVGGGFLTVKNGGAADDRLVSVTSPTSGEVQIHEMAMQDNVMKMRQLKDGIVIPAGQTVELKPGGFHLMFQKVRSPFRQGDTVPVTLTFEKAGRIELQLPVLSAQGK